MSGLPATRCEYIPVSSRPPSLADDGRSQATHGAKVQALQWLKVFKSHQPLKGMWKSLGGRVAPTVVSPRMATASLQGRTCSVSARPCRPAFSVHVLNKRTRFRSQAIRGAQDPTKQAADSVHRVIINLLQQPIPQHNPAHQIGKPSPGRHQHTPETLIFQLLKTEGTEA